MLRIYYIDRNQLRLDLADGIIELTKEIFPLDERIDPSEFPCDPYRYGEALYVKTKALMNYDYGETDREHNKEGEAVCREMISVIDRMRKFTPVFPKQITHLEGLAYNQLGMFISAGIKQLDLLIRKGLVQLPLDALKSHVSYAHPLGKEKMLTLQHHRLNKRNLCGRVQVTSNEET